MQGFSVQARPLVCCAGAQGCSCQGAAAATLQPNHRHRDCGAGNSRWEASTLCACHAWLSPAMFQMPLLERVNCHEHWVGTVGVRSTARHGTQCRLSCLPDRPSSSLSRQSTPPAGSPAAVLACSPALGESRVRVAFSLSSYPPLSVFLSPRPGRGEGV